MPDKKSSIEKRLHHIYQGARTVIDQYHPDEIAIEDVFVNQLNPNSALKLGMARGILIMLAALYQLELGEYSNRTVKQAITGSGRAQKPQIQQMVLKLLPKAKTSITRHDSADALAIAITHAHRKKIAEKWNPTDPQTHEDRVG